MPRGSKELPTWLVAAAIYAGWFGLTLAYRQLPWWAVALAGGWLVAWHGSLQHETIHGHPTRSRRINAALGMPPLGLWMPYALYRESHLAHHRSEQLTDPLHDPESHFVSAESWRRASSLARALRWIDATLLGRLVLGPFRVVAELYASEARRIARGDRARLRIWLAHAALVALLLGWCWSCCGITPWAYLALFVYPGLSWTLLRSFAEHAPASDHAAQSAVVEAAWPLALLFLHNNLHALHHARPGVPWYELPALHRRERARIARNGGPVFSGYGELVRRYALSPLAPPVHPGEEA